MPELMNAFSAIAAAAESTNAVLISDYNEAERLKKYVKSNLKVTDSIEDATIGTAMQSKRSVGIGHIHTVKQLALMRIPSVLISLNRNPVNYAINIYPESIQELYDDIICSFKLSEDKKVLLPIVIHVDSLLKETRAQLEVMTQKITENFMDFFAIDKPEKIVKFTLPDNIESMAIIQKAFENSKKVIEDVSEQFRKRTKRSFITMEKMIDGAELLLVSYGPISINSKLAVKKLNELGEKVGAIRIHILRPFPDIPELKSAKKIASIDTKFFLGSSGMLHQEIRFLNKDTISFIADIPSIEDITQIFQHLKSSDKVERMWMI